MQVDPAAYDDTLYPKLPQQMNYQEVLKDSDGNPIDGSHDLTLTIYKGRRVGINASRNEVDSATQTSKLHESAKQSRRDLPSNP
jgi:hypothetical protein